MKMNNDVDIKSLIEKSKNENIENRYKMYNNLNKELKDIEPFENKIFLEMIDNIFMANSERKKINN
jgi:hypothetical protein